MPVQRALDVVLSLVSEEPVSIGFICDLGGKGLLDGINNTSSPHSQRFRDITPYC